MKQVLFSLGLLISLIFSTQTTLASCPCVQEPASQCEKCYDEHGGYDCCCEDWLSNIENYFCRIGLNESQKCEAREAINKFVCNTENLEGGCGCEESKCACREYKKELKKLDCDMKKIITKCQKDDYNKVKLEIKDQVKCCHKCLIWPFSKCNCKTCCK